MGLDAKGVQHQNQPGGCLGLGCFHTFFGIPLVVLSLAVVIKMLFFPSHEIQKSPYESALYDRLTDDEKLLILERLIDRLTALEEELAKHKRSIQAFEDSGGFHEEPFSAQGRQGHLHRIWLTHKTYHPAAASFRMQAALRRFRAALNADDSHRLLARDAQALDDVNLNLGVFVLGATSFNALVDPNFPVTSMVGPHRVLDDLRAIDTAVSAKSSR